LEVGVLKGWWYQNNYGSKCGPDNVYSGPLVFRFAPDGRSFTGLWGTCGTTHENLPAANKWNGTLKQGAIALGGQSTTGGTSPSKSVTDTLIDLGAEALKGLFGK
jgi:hypothetical protein